MAAGPAREREEEEGEREKKERGERRAERTEAPSLSVFSNRICFSIQTSESDALRHIIMASKGGGTASGKRL